MEAKQNAKNSSIFKSSYLMWHFVNLGNQTHKHYLLRLNSGYSLSPQSVCAPAVLDDLQGKDTGKFLFNLCPLPFLEHFLKI